MAREIELVQLQEAGNWWWLDKLDHFRVDIGWLGSEVARTVVARQLRQQTQDTRGLQAARIKRYMSRTLTTPAKQESGVLCRPG